MTNETDQYRTVKFTTAKLPWILGLAMLALYLATLNHWITGNSVYPMADVCGWTQGMHFVDPIFFLVTLPLKVLPISKLPLALNLVSAICAGVVLMNLARSVSLLPHDRTHDQRENEHNDAALNSHILCWLPPVFAVLALGLERTFWESAIEGTGKMIILLLFSYCVRCILEFRLSGDEKWMSRLALTLGLSVANNWIMVGFFPMFIVATIWIKGLKAFESGFIKRMFLYGAVGLLLLFLYPIINGHSHGNSGSIFWQTLRNELLLDKNTLLSIPKKLLLTMASVSILPVFIMGIKWASYFGDNSPFGIFLATATFHLMHAMFLVAGIWVAMDSPISPRMLLEGYGSFFLPVYLLVALSLGYFLAYFQVVFGKNLKQKEILPQMLGYLVSWIVTFLAIATPIIMFGRNMKHMKEEAANNADYESIMNKIEESLPPKGAVIMSDDIFRLMYLRFHISQKQQNSPYMYVDTSSLLGVDYVESLKKDYPDFGISMDWTKIPKGASQVLMPVQFLGYLQEKHDLYYIHGSFGYYFERFYGEQHGLVYKMLPFPEGVWDAVLPNESMIAENNNFWTKFCDGENETLHKLITKNLARTVKFDVWDKLGKLLRLKPEKETVGPLICTYCSRAVNDWGVTLMRAGKLTEANNWFKRAMEINTENGSAFKNAKVAERLMESNPIPIIPQLQIRSLENELGIRGGGWSAALFLNGPIDEPNYRINLSTRFGVGGNWRQAVQNLHRSIEIAPEEPMLKIQLAKMLYDIKTDPNWLTTYLPYTNCYKEAITNADYVLDRYPESPTGFFIKSLSLMQLGDYAGSAKTLSRLIELQPTNAAARLDRAIAYLQMTNLDAAKRDYQDVASSNPKASAAYFGLADIAYRQKDTKGALQNYQTYLSIVPTNTMEAKRVMERIEEMKAAAP